MSLFRAEVRAAQAERLHGEVILRQHNSHLLLAALLVSIILAAGIWVSLSSFARIETAPGILATTSPTAKIFASRPGLVTHLGVREGQLVRVGAPLVTVNADVRDQSGVAAAADSAASVRDQLLLADSQIALLARTQQVETARLTEVISSGERQLEALARQLDVQNQIVASQKELFEQLQGVAERGFISRSEYERRRQTYLAATQSSLQIEQQIMVLRSQVAQARSGLQNASVVFSRDVATMESNMESLKQQHIQFAGAETFVVAAPIAGRVTAVQTGIGQVVQPATPLFSIVPENAILRAEVYAPTRAVGLIEVGQVATLALHAFPYQRFGTARGRVLAISRVALSPEEVAAPLDLREPVYKIVIAIERQTMVARGTEHPLQPGMTLTANIVLERQTFLEWLLSPLTAVSKRV